jgi:hypothetical protein
VRRLCRRLGLGLLAVHPEGQPRARRGGPRPRPPTPPPPQQDPRPPRACASTPAAKATPPPAARPAPARSSPPTARRRCAAPTCCAGTVGGPLPVAQVREEAGAPNAARVLYRNVYGWFEPAGRGLYRLTEEGGKV